MKTLIVSLLCLCLVGCVTPREAFHIGNAIDFVQSANSISNGDCHEINDLTQAAIGDKPSTAEFAVWIAASSVAYELARHYLPEKWVPAFEWVALGWKTYVVVHNEYAGCGM